VTDTNLRRDFKELCQIIDALQMNGTTRLHTQRGLLPSIFSCIER
jgi:hypothetical protein